MKVALVHGQRVRGGAHRRIAEQARRLAADPGVDLVEIVVAGALPVTAHAVMVPLALRADTAPGWRRPYERYADLARLAVAYRALARVVAAADPDVVWANPCTLVQAPWVGRAWAARTVYYCDEPPRLHYDTAARATTRRRTRALYWPLRRLYRRLDAVTARRSARVLANSRYAAGLIERAYGRPAQVLACGVADAFLAAGAGNDSPRSAPSGADPAPGDPAPGDTATGATTAGDTTAGDTTAGATTSGDTALRQAGHVLSVGTLIPSKGHDLAVEAVAASGTGLPLVVVGHRDDPAEHRRLADLAAARGVTLQVRLAVTDTVLAALYRGALATVYLARGEPFGLASIESQACGTPAVVADEGGLPETVAGGGGWVVARAGDAAGERLRALAADPALRRDVAARARAAGAAWTWERSAAGLVDHLRAVAR